jgi:5'-AMP-activated protein kinase, regulatory gamma subunit
MQAAPLWDPKACQFVGLLTVTDFIDVLRWYRETGADVSSLSTRTIGEILSDEHILSTVLLRYAPRRGADPNSNNLNTSPVNQHKVFLSADANTSLNRACKLLHENSIDFLPVMIPDDMRVLATITYTTILEHLVTHFREQRRLFDDTVYDLRIGTYHENVITCNQNQKLADVLHTLHIHGLSAVPIVDEQNKVKAVYSRSDITFLASATDAQDALNNLDMTLEPLLAKQRQDVTTPDALHTCTTRHTLQSIFEYFAQWKFNRLVVVDDEERVIGIVSARDLVGYFLDDL